MKEDNSVGNSDAVFPSSSGSLTHTILSLPIEAFKDNIKPVVETVMAKGMVMWGTYEKYSADKKARVAKHAAEYGVLSTVQHFAKIWPDHPLKEGRNWRNTTSSQKCWIHNQDISRHVANHHIIFNYCYSIAIMWVEPFLLTG